LSNTHYKYEIAFSCLGQDEQLALNLEMNLKNRYSTFLYSEKQDLIAGNDGAEIFTKVFNTECRLAVVLFRQGWGKSGMTLIEKNALENRFLKEGYAFILFVLLNDSDIANLPIWYPKNYIWLGFQKYGINTLISAIENKIVELGGSYLPVTPTSLAKSTNKILELKEYRKSILKGINNDSILLAQNEVNVLFASLVEKFDEFNQHSKFKISYGIEENKRVHVEYLDIKMIIEWRVYYSNTLDGSAMLLYVFSGFLACNPKYFFKSEDSIDVLDINKLGWKSSFSNGKIVDTISYSDFIFNKYINLIQKLIKK